VTPPPPSGALPPPSETRCTAPPGAGTVPGPPIRVLAFFDFYLPGQKAGGALRSAANLVERLGERIRFRIVTRDRDLGDAHPYPGIDGGRWTPAAHAEVLYLPSRSLGVRRVARILRDTPADVMYLNSFFSARLTILPLILRRLGVVPRLPVVLAPRGELSDGCLALRSARKKVYIALASATGLLDGVVWQASTPLEAADIRRRLPRVTAGAGAVRVACDLPAGADPPALRTRLKAAGELRLLFLSRIHRVKNLRGIVEMLQEVQRPVEFNVYGPCEDSAYWEECRSAASALPREVRMTYRGALSHAEVGAVMNEHDLFVLPSEGENYGHVVYEALAAGCPVLISDRTPWRGLEARGAGWDVPLHERSRFTAVLRQVADMDEDVHALLREGARTLAREHASADAALAENARLFEHARAHGSPEPPCSTRAEDRKNVASR
jgi:glycosyltransferase involved in cell wall biosynthesis